LILQRTSDIGIMKALGAQERHINTLFLKGSLVQLCAGLIPGVLILFLLLPELLRQLEIEASVLTIILAAVSLLIAGIVILSSYLPLHRVHALAPQVALLNDQR
jgi:ABC-type antimicrobial peptide transport system permease subunit